MLKNVNKIEGKGYILKSNREEDAIRQIEDRQYDKELRSEGYKNIIKYGISFYQKDCCVKMADYCEPIK